MIITFSQLLFPQDVLSLAPRKVDWDLKRDIEEKLNKLQRRTQRAIIELTRKSTLSILIY